MRFFRWIGHLVARIVMAPFHLAAVAFIGATALFSASLDFALGIVSRLYERFDAAWARSSREGRKRNAREGRGTSDLITRGPAHETV